MTDTARVADPIVDATIAILEADGYGAVTLREVARRARVSLGTIYKRFPTRREHAQRTREALIAAAVEAWIDEHVLTEFSPPASDEPLHDGLMRMLTSLFGAWERSPRMLAAYHHVIEGPFGADLYDRTFRLLAPVGLRALEGRDTTFVDDVSTILGDASDAAIAKCAAGRLDVTEILPRLERVVYRLTHDNAAEADPAVLPSPTA
jgi:AcrR family transcriptional regulator